MFATLFLGAILAVFLTLNAVRGDAERGLLQPMIVRPLGRGTLLAGRYVAAAGVCVVYTLFVFIASVIITNGFIDWWPDRTIVPAIEMAIAVAVIAALALGGSVLLSSTANGIAIFMLFGAGLTAGLLGQIGEALNSDTLEDVSRTASWILPFEALYQTALSEITADTIGFNRFAIDLGPFGGAQEFGAPVVAVHGGSISPRSRPSRCGRSGAVTCERRRVGSSRPMIPVENIADWRGQEVVDPNGEKLGKLEEIYFDGETDEPVFGAVKTGLVSKSLTLVPLAAGERGP